MNRTTLKIDGMSCGHCVSAVTKALAELEGVTLERVTVGSAVVTYDAAVTSARQIGDAIGEAGYTVTAAA